MHSTRSAKNLPMNQQTIWWISLTSMSPPVQTPPLFISTMWWLLLSAFVCEILSLILYVYIHTSYQVLLPSFYFCVILASSSSIRAYHIYLLVHNIACHMIWYKLCTLFQRLIGHCNVLSQYHFCCWYF